ncbi:MAG: hypothetical protein Q8R43_03155 [Alphaproteobacteria bacterium]|nr:hypothetical protein [Alphaproteobacteria bacterium]
MKFEFNPFTIMVICTGIAFSSVLPTDVFGQSTTSPLMGNHPVYSSPTREVDESAFRSTIPTQLGPDISKYFSDFGILSLTEVEFDYLGLTIQGTSIAFTMVLRMSVGYSDKDI